MKIFYAKISEDGRSASVVSEDGEVVGTFYVPDGKTFDDYVAAPGSGMDYADPNGELEFVPAGDGDGAGGSSESPVTDGTATTPSNDGDGETPGGESNGTGTDDNGSDNGSGNGSGNEDGNDSGIGSDEYQSLVEAYNDALEGFGDAQDGCGDALDEAEGIGQEIESLNDEIEFMSGDIEDLSSDAEDLEDQLEDLQGDLDAMESKIDDLNGIGNDLGGYLDNLDDSFSSVEDLQSQLDTPSFSSGSGSGGESLQVQDPVEFPQSGADPVNLCSGSFHTLQTDVLIPGLGMDLSISRYYSNQLYHNGVFGAKWHCWFEAHIRELSDGTLYFWRPEGNGVFLQPDGNNGYIQPPGYFEIIRKKTNGFEVEDRFGTISYYTDNNALTKMSDRFGNDLTLTRNASNQVVSIRDDAGKTLTLTYDEGRVQSVTDHTGRVWTYTYVGDRLVRVRFPATEFNAQGRAVHYTYQNHADPRLDANLTVIGDHGSNAIISNTYGGSDLQFNRVVSQRIVNDEYRFTYEEIEPDLDTVPTNRHRVARKTSMINSRGIRTEYTFNPLGSVLSHKVITNGIRPGDPAFWEVTYKYDTQWNNNEIEYGTGLKVSFLFDTSNADQLKRGNILRMTVNPAGSGSNHVTQYQYGAYNQLTKIIAPDGREVTYTLNSLGVAEHIQYPDVTLADGSTQTIDCRYTYNGRGQINRFVNPEGDALDLTYFESGRKKGLLKTLKVNGSIQVQYDYDSLGRMVQLKDAALNAFTFGYTETDELRFEKAPAATGYEKKYSYSEEGFLIAEQLRQVLSDGTIGTPEWITKEYEHDLRGRIVKERVPLNATEDAETTYVWDGEGNITRRTLANGRVVHQTFDERNLLYQVFEMPGTTAEAIDTYAYDALGNPTSYKDPLNKTHFYTYDGFGWHVRTTDPLGNYVQLFWNLSSFLTKTEYRNAAGQLQHKEEYANDQLGRLYQTKITPVRNGSSLTPLYKRALYDRLGRPVTITDGSGNAHKNVFDALNNLVQTTDPLGNVTRYTYNKTGCPVTINHELIDTANPGTTVCFEQQQTFDVLGRMTGTRDAMGNAVKYQLNSMGLPEKVIRPDGLVESYEHDLAGRLTGVSVPWIDETGTAKGTITRTHSYDAVSNPVSVTDAKGHTSQFHYDVKGNLLQVELPDGTDLYRFAYDEYGQLIQRTDANGNDVHYTYDALHRLVRKDIAKATGTEGVSFEQLTYNVHGQVTGITDGTHVLQRTYDSLGRMHTETVNGQTTAYAYHSDGLLSSILYPGGLKIGYQWDANARIQSMKLLAKGSGYTGSIPTSGELAAFDYLGHYLLSGIRYRNGVQQRFSYDASSRISGIDQRDAAGQTTDKIRYLYDAMGQVRLVNREGVSLKAFSYDSLGQLAAVTEHTALSGVSTDNWTPSLDPASPLPAGSQATMDSYLQTLQPSATGAIRVDALKYDKSGNRVRLVRKQGSSTTTTDYTTNERNQYTQVGAANLQYDANGNLLADGTYTYTYDYRNRLIRVLLTATGVEVFSFSYDAQNRLIAYTQGGVAHTLTYVGPEAVEHTSAGTTSARVPGIGIDRPVLELEGNEEHYYTSDTVNTVISIYAGDGSLEARIVTDEFGTIVKALDAASNEVDLPEMMEAFFQGRPSIEGTALMNFRARHYSTELGRFLQTDPMGYAGGLNLYQFAQNNPLGFVDPDGQLPFLLIIGIGALIGGGIAAAMNWDKSGTDFWVSVLAGAVGGGLMATGYGVISFAAGGAASGMITGGYEGYKAGGAEGMFVGGGLGGLFGGLGGAAGGALGGRVGTAVTGRVYSNMVSRGYNEVTSNVVAGYAGVGAGGVVNGGTFGGFSGFGLGMGHSLASGDSVSESIRNGASSGVQGAGYGALFGGTSAVGFKGAFQLASRHQTRTTAGMFGQEGEWNTQNGTWQRMNTTQTTPSAIAGGSPKVPDLWGAIRGDVKNTAKLPSPRAQNSQFQSFYNEIVTNRNEVFHIYHRPGIQLPGPRSAVGRWAANGQVRFVPIPQYAYSTPTGRNWNS